MNTGAELSRKNGTQLSTKAGCVEDQPQKATLRRMLDKLWPLGMQMFLRPVPSYPHTAALLLRDLRFTGAIISCIVTVNRSNF